MKSIPLFSLLLLCSAHALAAGNPQEDFATTDRQLLGVTAAPGQTEHFLVGRNSRGAQCTAEIDRLNGSAQAVTVAVRPMSATHRSLFTQFSDNEVRTKFPTPMSYVVTAPQFSSRTTKVTLVAQFVGAGRTGIENLRSLNLATRETLKPLPTKVENENCSSLKTVFHLTEAEGDRIATQALKFWQTTPEGRTGRQFDEATHINGCSLVTIPGRTNLGLRCFFDLSPAEGDGDEPNLETTFEIVGPRTLGKIIKIEQNPN